MLPDGTIVVPIGSEDDEDGIEPGSDENESKYGTILDKILKKTIILKLLMFFRIRENSFRQVPETNWCNRRWFD